MKLAPNIHVKYVYDKNYIHFLPQFIKEVPVHWPLLFLFSFIILFSE